MVSGQLSGQRNKFTQYALPSIVRITCIALVPQRGQRASFGFLFIGFIVNLKSLINQIYSIENQMSSEIVHKFKH
jgi:hypothetical protein